MPPRAKILQAPDHGVESTPAPHAHWTLYEALQQPMAIARALAFGGAKYSTVPKIKIPCVCCHLQSTYP